MIATMRPSMQIDIVELQQATNYGYLMAVFLWVYGSVSSFSGLIADRINRKRLIIGSLFVWSMVTFAMGFATNFNALYWLRALMGLSEAIYIPAGLSLIADYHSDKTRSLAVGLHMSGMYMGQALGDLALLLPNYIHGNILLCFWWVWDVVCRGIDCVSAGQD